MPYLVEHRGREVRVPPFGLRVGLTQAQGWCEDSDDPGSITTKLAHRSAVDNQESLDCGKESRRDQLEHSIKQPRLRWGGKAGTRQGSAFPLRKLL